LKARLKSGTPFSQALVDSTPQPENKRSFTVEAFGEQKSAADWARDPRCKVNEMTLRSRLRKGFSPERALTEPTREIGVAFGEEKPLVEWYKDARVPVSRTAVFRRLKGGAPLEEALTTPYKTAYRRPNTILVSIFGETKPIKEWIADPRCEVSPAEFRTRIRKGMDPETALKFGLQLAGRTTYEAFGETKVLLHWAKDPRCIVSISTLRLRVVIEGEPMGQAMTRPAGQALRAIWDIEKFRGGEYEALEIEASQFRRAEPVEEKRSEQVRVPYETALAGEVELRSRTRKRRKET